MSSKKLKVHFIINPHSGIRNKLSFIDLVEDESREDFEIKTTLTQRPEHATEIAREAVEKGVDMVVAVGGDGSVNEVGKALIGTNIPMGVVPFGSGNGFARHMQIPLNEKEALKVINRFRVRTIDTGTANGEPFLATAGLGFDAHVGWRFAKQSRRGFTSYVRVTTQSFFGYKPKIYQFIVDGKEIETTAFLINFANAGQYGNNAWIAPSANIADGMLNVCILDEFPKQVAPDILFKLFNKSIENSKYYRLFMGKEIIVKQPGIYHLDGEPRTTDGDLIIRVVPHSLHVVC